jgi:hypothetical protein
MVNTHYPPITPYIDRNSLKIFLAGTIDMGLSIDWQSEIGNYISTWFNACPIDIFNPRRSDWDSRWEQSKSHPMFKRQVEWELKYQEEADVIIMILLPNSQSPISLMELGSFKDKSMLVYNPQDFYRHGNVDIFCSKYGIPTLDDWNDYLIATRRFIHRQIMKLAK